MRAVVLCSPAAVGMAGRNPVELVSGGTHHADQYRAKTALVNGMSSVALGCPGNGGGLHPQTRVCFVSPAVATLTIEFAPAVCCGEIAHWRNCAQSSLCEMGNSARVGPRLLPYRCPGPSQ